MARPNIAVVDYHKGNLLSVVRSLSDVGARAEATDDPSVICAADAVVVPGVGAFEDAMSFLVASGEGDAIKEAASRGVPFLGICLGLHVLFERGDGLVYRSLRDLKLLGNIHRTDATFESILLDHQSIN